MECEEDEEDEVDENGGKERAESLLVEVPETDGDIEKESDIVDAGAVDVGKVDDEEVEARAGAGAGGLG